ncbi:hypothetical protein AMTRI_Chr10g350 [Amborella trichopoda]
MGVPHALVIPYPAQGHVIPMMQLSRRMVEHGFIVTFVNTDFNHKRVLEAALKAHSQSHPNKGTGPIRLVSIPDGLKPDADRNQLETLIKEINGLEGDSVTCVVADVSTGWALDKSGTGYPEGFLGRVAAYGKLLGWCPQKKVLAHPSIASFVTHYGWNSTLEGLSNGVPFICWPYFADQFLNQTYIVDIWKVGVGLKANEDGIFSKEEIKSKVEEMLGDEGIRERVLKLKEEAISSVTEGSSVENLLGFMEAMKGKS